MKKIDLVILTGVSGAGKTTVTLVFEELSYYVVSNVPVALSKPLFDEFIANPAKYKKVLLSTSLNDCIEVYNEARKHIEFNVMFIGLDAKYETLVERYRLTRHAHPLQAKGLTLEQALNEDRKQMDLIKESFTHYVDTSKYSKTELRTHIYDITRGVFAKKMTVIFSSFGYKKTLPMDLDVIIDARILPNPYWEEDLKELTGLDKRVQDYVLDSKLSKEYLKKITNYLDLYLSELDKAGRSLVNIGIGCSGGQHRSVTLAIYLKNHYGDRYNTIVEHRDMPRSK